MNLKTPFFSHHHQIMIRPTSKTLPTFSAVTKDAIPITFSEVEVISSVPQENVLWLVKVYGRWFRQLLVFDRLKEEIRRHCSTHNIVSIG